MQDIGFYKVELTLTADAQDIPATGAKAGDILIRVWRSSDMLDLTNSLATALGPVVLEDGFVHQKTPSSMFVGWQVTAVYARWV